MRHGKNLIMQRECKENAKRTQREKPDVGKGEAGENTELELLAKEDLNKTAARNSTK